MCAACDMENQGWDGRGCCDTCNQYDYQHTCEEEQ